MSKPIITTETITPEMADTILKMNTRNRIPHKHHIDKIADAMKAGTFHFTGDAIRLGKDGTLFDGQHRLMACIQANVPFQTVVIKDLETDALLVIDGGITRSKAQQLHIAAGKTPFTTDTAQMLIRLAIGNAYRNVSTDTLLSIIEKHPTIAEVATAYESAAKFGMGGNIPAGELILKANGYQDEAAAWRQLWVDGLKTDMTHACHAVRQHLIRLPETKNGARLTWNLIFKRKVLAQLILKTAGHLDAPGIWKPTDPRFPNLAPAMLLTTTSFNTTDQTKLAAMSTTSYATLHLAKTSQKRRRAKPETEAETQS